MSEKDSFASLMGDYLHEQGGKENPKSIEREVLHIIPFAQVNIDYSGRGMELPSFDFLALDSDELGKFVRVQWGYGRGHHSVSQPVMVKDRRSQMVAIGEAKFNLLRQSEITGRLKNLNTEMTEIDQEMVNISKVTGDDEEKQIQLNKLTRVQERIQSLIEAIKLDARPIEDTAVQLAQNQVMEIFKTGGICQETRISNPVAGKPRVELEIIDMVGAENMGDLTFKAVGMHIPKPFPLGIIALGELSTLLALQPEPVFGGETVGSSVTKQNGIYRYIHFSSGTGRHSGWGHLTVLPKI